MEESQESKRLGDRTCLNDFHVTLYSRVTPQRLPIWLSGRIVV